MFQCFSAMAGSAKSVSLRWRQPIRLTSPSSRPRILRKQFPFWSQEEGNIPSLRANQNENQNASRAAQGALHRWAGRRGILGWHPIWAVVRPAGRQIPAHQYRWNTSGAGAHREIRKRWARAALKRL